MEYYIINTDAISLGYSPHDMWIERGLAIVGGSEHAKQLNKLKPGDICFMYANKQGIVAAGNVLERWDGRPHRLGIYSETEEYCIRVNWWMDLRERPVSPPEIRRITGYIPPKTLQRLGDHEIAERLFERCLAGTGPVIADEIPYEATELLLEGTPRQMTAQVYERNRGARQKCIEHYGTRCVVCGHTLEEMYGMAGTGLIHVHHVRELSSIGEQHEVDPIKDLRPVCPNCHAIIHTRKPAYSIEEVRTFYREQR